MMFRSLQSPLFATLSFWLVLFLSACSDSTELAENIGDRAATAGEGTINPNAGTFILKIFDSPPPGGGPAVPVQLVGSNLVVAPGSGVVSIDVALGNLHSEPLFAPAVIWLSELVPPHVEVLNPDLVRNPGGPDPDYLNGEVQHGFDYTEFFGEDGVLGPGETSEPKTWSFLVGDGISFSFAARAEFSMVPDLPRIAGFCWFDENHDGVPEPHENPLEFGYVNVRFPNGDQTGVWVGPGGHYSLPVEDAGLYQLHFDPMIDTFVPIGFSTPNPLEVLLTPGPDGRPNSFLHANFGIFTQLPGMHVIQFTNESPDSLQVGSYQLIDVCIEPPMFLKAHVGFSGCSPEESFSLFMTGGFMESSPPQANIVLRKDWESDCDAVWNEEIRFDLGPLAHRYLESYGPGSLILNLHDAAGDVHLLEVGFYPPDDLSPGGD